MSSAPPLPAVLPTVDGVGGLVAPTVDPQRKASNPPEAGPKAELTGTLVETPLPQLLLMILTRAYSGSLLLRNGDETEIVLFARGAITHVLPARTLPSVGEVLVSIGVVKRDELAEAVAASKTSGARLADELVRSGRVTPEILDWVTRAQILERVRAMVGVPPASTFEFHAGANLLAECDTPDDAVSCDPLEVVLAAARHFREHDRMEEGLARLGDRPLRLHARARIDRFALTDAEQKVIDRVRHGAPVSYRELRLEGPESVVRPLVYALTFTRHLESGVAGAFPAHVPREAGEEVPLVSAETRRGRHLVQLAMGAGTLTHYEILDVAREAPAERIREAAARIKAEIDPAQLTGILAPLVPSAQRLSARVGRASETLIDVTRRREYDAVIAREESAEPEAHVEDALAAADHHRKAEALVRSGDPKAAERMAARAVRLDPDSSEHVALLGWIRGTLDPSPEAQKEALDLVERAITLDPRSDRALVYRAMILGRLGREAEALRDFARAVEINPANVDAARGARASRKPEEVALEAQRKNAPATEPEAARSSRLIPLLLVAVLLLVVAAVMLRSRALPSTVRDEVIAFGLELELRAEGDERPTEHEGALFQRGDVGAALVAQLLLDTHRVEDGNGSFTERPVQAVANEYLLRYAAHLHRDPPPVADDMVRDLGSIPPPDAARWQALQASWLVWLSGKSQ